MVDLVALLEAAQDRDRVLDGAARSTITGWKRRSRAASFSMCLRYSSSVVAPMQRSSPRASAGLSRLPASIAPSAAPAPTIGVELVDEEDDPALGGLDLLEHGLQAVLELAAVLRAGDERAHVERDERLSLSHSGTSPRTMRWARPSTIAVLPTPGSPMRTGLFLVRRERTWIDAADLLVAADDRVELALRRAASVRSRAVLLERLELPLGVLVGDALAAADLRRAPSAARG